MSDLLRKMAKPPPPPSIASANGAIPEEDAEGDSSSASSMSSVGTIVPTSTTTPLAASPVPWHAYFEQELFLEHDGTTHHVYVTPPQNVSTDVLFVCHHGAGASGMSFALLAVELKRLLPSAGILSIEARDHGLTVTSEVPADLSLPTLQRDLESVVDLAKVKLQWDALPKIVLVGHSVGGVVVTQVAKASSYGNKLVGSVVIDVVEGSALETVRGMESYVAKRPTSFESLQEAMDWHIRSHAIRNRTSVELSTPPLLRETASDQWIWRTDLSATKQYWQSWFTGMSKAFLEGKTAKLLVLAGTDRLDKELMIGQMRGAFQLSIFPEAGHFVQEDVPDKLAELLVEFYKRNDRSTLVLPPKVSDLIKQGKKV
ncbi:MAG: Protein phosphatase methylesterase 1 [Chrysothrix sp. TS-e1954]|nr:MAG: Protein phosphatase methylesterase 1 [Chrysothrix sp. TS-e1954]